MPATWGYGAAGNEPITMAGWGFLADLEGTEVALAPVILYAKGPKHKLYSKDPKHRLYAKGPKHKLYKV